MSPQGDDPGGRLGDGKYARVLLLPGWRELARRVPGATFRHGKVFGSPGEQRFHYYAEFEWPDQDAFREASRSDEFMETGKDAMEMGVPFNIHFVDVE